VDSDEVTFKEKSMFGLEGKRIVVSGAASGIGLAIVEHLVEEGAQPVLLDISAEGLAAALRALPKGDKPWPNFVCDVADDAAVAETFRHIESEIGPLYGAVASAGIRNYGLATELSAVDWRRVIDINLNGVFYFCSEAARACTRAGGGSIVTLSSVAAFGGLPQRVNYCAAKAGVMNLTKVMAIELATKGVRVNAVAPGSVETPLAAQNTPEQRQRMISRTPLGRLAQPREVSNIVLFLLSDLSSYVTGTSVLADGGWTAALM
jgi:3-oxoacyl-[acyl-carrier protein] reductase